MIDLESRTTSSRERKSTIALRLHGCYSTLAPLPTALLPSFLRFSSSSTHHHLKPPPAARKLFPTSYLNGLRGFIAYIVFLRHFLLPWIANMDRGFGYGHDSQLEKSETTGSGSDEDHRQFLRLPFIRLFYAGPSVPIFLIISGYVLSLKPLKQIQQRAWKELLFTLCGGTFRRGMRLFLPTIISTFGVMIAVRLGLFNFDYELMPGRKPPLPDYLPTLWAQVGDWASFVVNELTNPWVWEPQKMAYGLHLWTIPQTFRASMVGSLVLVALARAKPPVRGAILVLGGVYCLSQGRWDVACFLSGTVIGERNLSALEAVLVDDARAVVVEEETKRRPRQSRRAQAMWVCVLLAGLYIGSFPRYNKGGRQCVFGYKVFCTITKDYRYWASVAGMLIIWAISNVVYLQWIFTSSFLQYLGRISYSTYIVHEPLLYILGFRVVVFMRGIVGKGTFYQELSGFCLSLGITSFCLVWVADLFNIMVEQPCGRFAAWVERKCFLTPE